MLAHRGSAVAAEDGTDVLIFSAETGALVHERTFPGLILADIGSGEPLIARSSFSDDGRYATWVSDCDRTWPS